MSEKPGTSNAIIERSFIETRRSYESTVRAFESSLGHFDQQAAAGMSARAEAWPDVEAAMAKIAGPSGLMILGKFDQGMIASLTGAQVCCRLYMVGNPAIAARIVTIDLRACLYVPFRVAIYAADATSGATISFDRPSSSLRTLDQTELWPIGQMLDQKIDAVVQSIVGQA